MLNHEITSKVGRHKRRRRVGRGPASGQGKTCGRGHKGAGSRAGSVAASVYEGGQMPLFRRLPKRGFNNAKFATRCEIVNICQLERFEDGASVNIEQLSAAGLVVIVKSTVNILCNVFLTSKLVVIEHNFSKSAEEKIAASGGTAKVI